jgi:hypothetical protein
MALPTEYDEDQPGTTAADEAAESVTFERQVRSAAAGHSDQAKFDTDPEWLSARQVLEAEMPGYADLPQGGQRIILAGMMSDYMTACLSRRTPRSVEAYVSAQVYYRSIL